MTRGGGHPGQNMWSQCTGVWGIVISLLYSGLGKERPKGPIGLQYFEVKHGRVAMPVNPHLNGVPFQITLLVRAFFFQKKDWWLSGTSGLSSN
jgi:hypothetical protein